MPTLRYIETRGFRKWYERELIRGHSHLVLLLLCTVAVLGALEAAADLRGSARLAVMAASVVVAGGVGVWAMRRYLFVLMRAEHVANQAVCPQCQTYARWHIVGHDVHDDDRNATSCLDVCCRQCEHRWRIAW